MAIGNKNPAIRELVPELMGGIGSDLVRQDPQRPNTNWLRPVHVSTRIGSSYVVPGDWPAKPDGWFADDAPTYPLRRQNNVEYFIDGEPTYEAMVEAIETAETSEHFIVLVGWTLHVDFALSKTGNRTSSARNSLLKVLRDRLALGVTVCVLIYNNQLADGILSPPVFEARVALLGLDIPNARIVFIIDEGYRGIVGCHHQKVLVVHGREGLVGFFGGVDFNPDRVEADDKGGPQHDVHARVTGEAADDLLVLATNRWNFAVPIPYAPGLPKNPGSATSTSPNADGNKVHLTGRSVFDMTILLDRARAKPIATPGPYRMVKIGQTVGNPALAALQKNGVFPNVRKILKEAKNFIYIEDQYLWSVHATELLGEAAQRISGHVTILFPRDESIPSPGARHKALKRLKEACGTAANKIAIYVIREAVHSYVHAKMFVVDDHVAIIGSANCNNRGYFHDSEVNGVIADHEWAFEGSPWMGKWWRLDLALAHKLRMELWSEHLRMPADALIDGVAAEVHWKNPPPNARIKPYEIDRKLWYDHEYNSSYGEYPVTDPMP